MTDPRPRNEDELVELVRSIDVPAPATLHERVRSLIAEQPPATSRRRRAGLARRRLGPGRPLGGRLAAAGGLLAVAIAVLVLALSSGGGSSTLTLAQATALTRAPATAPAPRESSANHARLTAAVDHVAFPYWAERFGWRATGMRRDRIGGRAITTVFYADRGRRIGYTIVGGRPALSPDGGAIHWSKGVAYHLRAQRGVAVVTWLREGHLCAVSGHGVDGATLLRLASWTDRNSLPA
jgi:hypothetical protein